MKTTDTFITKDGEFSWRKALTALTAVLFCGAVISFLFGAPELPQSYILIISGVFAFYFLKNRLSGDSPWSGAQNIQIKPNIIVPSQSTQKIDEEIGNTTDKPI